MIGPGKYDDLCTYVRTTASADGAAIIVIRGNKGSGLSVQASVSDHLTLAAVLRQMADKMVEDVEALSQGGTA